MNAFHRFSPLIFAISLSGAAPGALATNHMAPSTGPMMGAGMGPGMMMTPSAAGCPGMGSGMGPGAGYGMGPGMAGAGPMGMGRMGFMGNLNLNDAQMEQVARLRGELQQKHRKLMQQMWEHQDQLQALYLAEKRDSAAIGKVYGRMSELQREMLESHVEMEKRMEAVLSKEQREQLQRHFRGWGMMYR